MAAFAVPCARSRSTSSGRRSSLVRARHATTGSTTASSTTWSRASGGKPATVAVVPNYNFFSVSNLRYEAMARGLPVRDDAGVERAAVRRRPHGAQDGLAGAELLRGKAGGHHAGLRRRGSGPGDDLSGVAEYPLPDGSRAILRARRIPPLAGVEPAEVARGSRRRKRPPSPTSCGTRSGLRITLDYRPDAILRGEVDRVRVEAEAATIGELKRRDRAPLRVRDVRVEVDRLLVNPHRLMRSGAIEVLDAGALRIEHAVITQADLDALLAGQPAGSLLSVELTDGWADVRGKGLPGSAKVGMAPGHPDVALHPQGRGSAGRRTPRSRRARRLGRPALRPDEPPPGTCRSRSRSPPSRSSPAASRSAR